MAEQITSAEWMCVDQYDISGCSSNFGFERMVDLEEAMSFLDPTLTSGLIYKRRIPGAESAKSSIAGYLDMAISHPALSAAFAAQPTLTYGLDRALGSQVYMFLGREGTLNYGGQVSKIVPVAGELSSDGLVMPGALFEFGAKTATGNGTSRTVAAVTTGKTRVIHVHIVAISGTATPTITIIFETSALGDYTDAVTRWTSAAFTDVGKERAVIPSTVSEVSDTNGRFRWTISGTNPSFLVRMSEGVR